MNRQNTRKKQMSNVMMNKIQILKNQIEKNVEKLQKCIDENNIDAMYDYCDNIKILNDAIYEIINVENILNDCDK